jgi:hypothetical protein
MQIMAETPETNKPDFRNGFPIRDLPDREFRMEGIASFLCPSRGALSSVSI